MRGGITVKTDCTRHLPMSWRRLSVLASKVNREPASATLQDGPNIGVTRVRVLVLGCRLYWGGMGIMTMSLIV